MNKTRVFSDIDLNFTPVPSAYDRYDVPVDLSPMVIDINGNNVIGRVLVTGTSDSPIIVGENTLFKYMLQPNDNLYVSGKVFGTDTYYENTFIGKIKTIDSPTQITLYANCTRNFQLTLPGDKFTYSTPGDIAIRFDSNAIKASVKNLILTMNYERPFNSKIGSQVKTMMFELATPMSSIMMKQSIINTITAFEPRVVLIDVVVDIQPESHNINVSIYFQIINTTEPLQIDLVLTRAR